MISESAAPGLRAWRKFIDFVAPPRCAMCHQTMEEPAALCARCWPELKQIDGPLCPVLGTPFPYDPGEDAISAAALADPPAWDGSRAAVAYEGAARMVVQALKYRDQPEAGHLMARMMARSGADLLALADVIVPVPLHRLRLWRRRFNQAALLAQHLADMSGKAFAPQALTRAKATRPQVGLDHKARVKNMKNAFAVRPEDASAIAGRRVVLVDDVRTTGATAEACARTLRAGGATHVGVLTFALVLDAKRFHM